MKEIKPGDTVYTDPELQKQLTLQDNLFKEFTEKYFPSNDTRGCELKTTWEIQDMFSGITDLSRDEIAIKLDSLGFKAKIIGAEYRWLLLPRS